MVQWLRLHTFTAGRHRFNNWWGYSDPACCAVQSGKKKITKKPVYCHFAYLTYMQSISCEMLDWMKHKLESRLLGEISITSDMQMTPPLWQKAKRN